MKWLYNWLKEKINLKILHFVNAQINFWKKSNFSALDLSNDFAFDFAIYIILYYMKSQLTFISTIKAIVFFMHFVKTYINIYLTLHKIYYDWILQPKLGEVSTGNSSPIDEQQERTIEEEDSNQDDLGDNNPGGGVVGQFFHFTQNTTNQPQNC
jgi:hypothetical protein